MDVQRSARKLAKFLGYKLSEDGEQFKDVHGFWEDVQGLLSWEHIMEALSRMLDMEVVQEDMELFYTVRDGIPNRESTLERLTLFLEEHFDVCPRCGGVRTLTAPTDELEEYPCPKCNN